MKSMLLAVSGLLAFSVLGEAGHSAAPLAVPLAATQAADTGAKGASTRVLSAFGREIDLQAYLEVPEQLIVDQEARRIYLAVAAAEARHLAQLPLPDAKGAVRDFASAKTISTVDLSKRNFWGAGYSQRLGKTLVLTDEAGEERLNLYTVEADGALKRLTDVGYIYGWAISPDGRWLAYSSRESVEFSPGMVRVIDLKSGAERVLFRDSKALRPYWGAPAWRADSGAFLLPMVANEDRALQNVALFVVDAAGPARADSAIEPRLMTDKSVRRELVLPQHAWVDDKQFIYLSTERGQHELFLRAGDGRVKQLTQPVRAVGMKPAAGDGMAGGNRTAAAVVHANGRPYAVSVIARPVLDSVQVLELPSGKAVFEQSMAEAIAFESALGEEAILRTSSQSNPDRLIALRPAGDTFALTPLVEHGAAEGLVHCIPQKISYRTFDGLSAPGETGTLHAWLYRPKKPLPKDRATLLIEAFYGGSKRYSTIYPMPPAQLFCAAGIHVLSPAPRGSAELGKEFRHLIRGDLGGNEILDIVSAAKWGQRTLGIPAERIGAFGLSHGGYATMRLLTLPEKINGQRTDFRFGFGISDAGISNLVRHANNSNIRGWSVDLMGDEPEKDAAKWLDRSPESGAARITGPLLLLHGTNDYRVRIIESQAMAKSLHALGKPVKLVELRGAAHGTAPVPQLYEYWRAVFDFLEEVVPPTT